MKYIIDLSVKRPITVFMAVIAIIIMGFISLSRLSIDFLPNMELPFINVSTSYSGSGPQEVEKSVTRLIESAVSGVNNVKNITSSSSEGRSSVSVEFNWGSDLPSATSDIREALDRVRRALPDGADTPSIMKFSTDMIPIMEISLFGSDDLAALYELADSQIVSKIEQVAGVARADLQGGLSRQIMVDVSLNRLQAYNLNINDVVRIIGSENQNIAGGTTYEGVYKYTLRTTGEFKTINDVGNVVVSMKSNVPVRLRDIANIYEGYENENRNIVRLNGTPAVSLSINKESGQNTVQVSKGVIKQLASLNLPEGVEYQVMFNSATMVEQAIAGVVTAAWQGAVFAVIILMLYLWNFRTVGIIGIAIPISIITTFTIMYFMDITLNIVSLSGLALGIGMMVDNSIVVLENIFHYRSAGRGKYSAAIEGTADVALAITASTFTTVAVFIPFLFVEGMTGQIFRDLCLTVTISMLTSLAVALTLVPTLSARMISTSQNKFLKPAERVTNKVLSKIDAIYLFFLKKSVKNKKKVIFISLTLVTLLLALGIIFISKEGYPDPDEGEMQVNITLPVGTRREQTDSFVSRMKEDLVEIAGKDFVRIQERVSGGGNANRGNLRLKLRDKTDGRTKGIEEFVEEARVKMSGYPGRINVNPVATMSMGGGGGFGGGGSGNINIEIMGNDTERGADLANRISAAISDIEGVREARLTREDSNPELIVKINRDLASKMGLNIATVANSIRTGFGGSTATRMTPEGSGTDLAVVVKLQEQDRINVEDVKRMMIPTPAGMVPVSAIAEIEKAFGPTSISRKDGKRVLSVSASTYGRAINEVVKDIQATIERDVYVPSDFIINYVGAFQDMQEAFAQLIQALILAIVLVYAIMASQFESLIAPFVIALALPFGGAGAIAALFITGSTLSVYSGIGIIVLVGIVINNGIVLIDYMNQLMLGKHGTKMSGNEAALEAGPRRMRPVMMTSLTTILGLFPMALGLGSGNELYKPLALSILGGLTLATGFTLIIVPTVYSAIRNKFPLKTYEEKDEASRLKDKRKKEELLSNN